MRELQIGTIGLNNAGKTVFHTVLYGFRNDFPQVTFSFPDDPTVAYLNPRWEAIERGELPEPTPASGLQPLMWGIRATDDSGVQHRYRVRAIDYAGRLVRRGEGEEIAKQARELGLQDFLDECDALLFLIDITDDAQVSAQLNTLEYILDRCENVPTKHGSTSRPVALVFTKCDAVPVLEMSHADDMSFPEVQARLLSYMDSHPRWRQLSRFMREHFRDRQLADWFPVSCFGCECPPGRAPTPGTIQPRWVHEPVVWALPRAAGLARRAAIATEVRFWAKRTAIVVLPLLALLTIFLVIQGMGYSSVMKKYKEVQDWADSNSNSGAATERLTRRVQFLTENQDWYTRRVLLNHKFLKEQRQQCENDQKTAINWIENDRQMYQQITDQTPVKTWEAFSLARDAAERYAKADRGKLGGIMRVPADQFARKLRAFDNATKGLRVSVRRVAWFGGAGLGASEVMVWLSHTERHSDGAWSKLLTDHDYSADRRKLTDMFVTQSDRLPIHVTVVNLSGTQVGSTVISLGDLLFKANQEGSVTVGYYSVILAFDCPPLQDLTLPPFSRPTLTEIPPEP